MSLAYTGMRTAHMLGAAGATNLLLQPFQNGIDAQSVAAGQKKQNLLAGAVIVSSLPATHELSAGMLIANPLSAAQVQYSTINDPSIQQKRLLTDAVNVDAEKLWTLAVQRFLSNADAFTSRFEAKTSPALPLPAQQKQPTAAPDISMPEVPDSVETTDHSKPAHDKQTVNAKTHIADVLLGGEIIPEGVSLELPDFRKTSTAAPTGDLHVQSAPYQSTPPKAETVVTTAVSPVEKIVPYPDAQLARARAVLGRAGRNSSEVSRARSTSLRAGSASDSCEVFRSHIVQGELQGTPGRAQRGTSEASTPAHPFQRWQAGPRHFRGITRFASATPKVSLDVEAREDRSDQIVRTASVGNKKLRLVFAPKTKGEYRFVGVEHRQKVSATRHRTAPHALMMPAEAAPRVFGLAPRSGGAPRSGSGSHVPTEPRELRADERKFLVKCIKDQLAKGPTAIDDKAIFTMLNDYLSSTGAGEIQPYEWNALLRASILYAARVVLPFMNKNVDDMASAILFHEYEGTAIDALETYATWKQHFGINGLGDVAAVDIFVADNCILTSSEYLLKGVYDHLMAYAAEIQDYDEDKVEHPFETELALQWEVIWLNINAEDNAELIDTAVAFVEEMAAIEDPQPAAAIEDVDDADSEVAYA